MSVVTAVIVLAVASLIFCAPTLLAAIGRQQPSHTTGEQKIPGVAFSLTPDYGCVRQENTYLPTYLPTHLLLKTLIYAC